MCLENGFARRFLVLPFTALAFWGVPQTGMAQAPSFDCGAATTKVERAVCADAHLADLDTRIAGLYFSALEADEDPNARRIVGRDQIAFLALRNRCERADDSARVECLRVAYESRLAALQQEVGQTPADANQSIRRPEADRPPSSTGMSAPSWSLAQTDQSLSAADWARPSNDSPYSYELTVVCNGRGNGNAQVTIGAFQDAGAGSPVAQSRPIVFLRSLSNDVSATSVRYQSDDGPLSDGIVLSTSVANVAGVQYVFDHIPSTHLLIANLFANESVEFRFASLASNERSAIEHSCFPDPISPEQFDLAREQTQRLLTAYASAALIPQSVEPTADTPRTLDSSSSPVGTPSALADATAPQGTTDGPRQTLPQTRDVAAFGPELWPRCSTSTASCRSSAEPNLFALR